MGEKVRNLKIPEVKICGLTSLEEAEFLNQVNADYAGFVFVEKSKRNITFPQAKKIQNLLSQDIKQVAVTVSPDRKLCQKIEEAGFDILQIHGRLEEKVLEDTKIPIWRACNIERVEELEYLEHHENIVAYVVDAKIAGGGKTFDWKACQAVVQKKAYYFHGKKFVLAGGLNSENVRDGIKIFAPDVIDVSSSVEIVLKEKERNLEIETSLKESFQDKQTRISFNVEAGFTKIDSEGKITRKEDKFTTRKDRQLVIEFVRKVREYEKDG